MLCDTLPLLADDDLQLHVLDDDTEPGRHSGRAFSEALAARQLDTPPVLLRSDAQGGFEAVTAFVAHHDLRPDVAENFTTVGSAVDDEMSCRIDLGAQVADHEGPLRGDLLPRDTFLPLSAPLAISYAPQGCLCRVIPRGRLPLEPAASDLPPGQAVGQVAPFSSLATL